MKKGYVYCLICPKTNQPRYVGQTVRTLETRLKEHKYKKDKKKTHKSSWIENLLKEGLLESLIICELGRYDVSEIDDMEAYWMDFFTIQNISLTNIIRGGYGGYREYSEERNKRISLKLTGFKRPPMSEKQKKQIGEFWKGNKNRLNKKHTEKTKNKISTTKKGTTAHNSKKIKQYDIEGNFIKEWNSSHEAAKELNLSQGNIATVASKNGRRKSTGGFIWKWSNNE